VGQKYGEVGGLKQMKNISGVLRPIFVQIASWKRL
jgi:hypothetical protein